MNEKQTHRQIEEQKAAGHDDPTVLMPRSDGTIQTAHLIDKYDDKGWQHAEFMDNGSMKSKAADKMLYSDDVQAKLAQTLAESAGRSPESWQRQTSQKDLGDVALSVLEVHSPQSQVAENLSEEKETGESERLEQMVKLAKDFIDQAEVPIREIAMRQSQLLDIFDESDRIFSHLNIGNISKPQAIMNLTERLSQARAIIQRDNELLDPLDQKSSAFNMASEELAHQLRQDLDADEDEVYKTKKIVEAAEAIHANLSVASRNLSNDLDQELSVIYRVVSDFEIDQQGVEHYSAQLRHLIKQVEETAVLRMRRLKYTESEFITLQHATKD
ncbi:MAG: hypothetical protein ABJA64_01625 [Candidatus Saccharibacteria bacterium]